MEDKAKENVGFLQKLFASIFGVAGSSAKKKELKKIIKILKKSRFKFYDPRLNDLEPHLARFIYSLYRFLGPIQPSLTKMGESQAIKAYIVEKNIPKEAFDIKEKFTEESIRANAQTMQTKMVAKE